MSDPALESYAATLAPLGYDKSEASVRRSMIESSLRASSLAVGSMFESGSWTHGTSIRAKSDVDYMAVATGRRPVRPSSALASAKAAIAGCDWKITSLAVSSPVVQVGYRTSPNLEIAPGWYKERTRDFNVYWIGGRGDEWVLSAPSAHLAYVNRQNDQLGKKVKPLIRLAKAWKNHSAAPVSSFYLEMRVAEYSAGESLIIYDVDLLGALRSIISFGARDMNDPERIVGRIPSCSSDEKRRTTLRLLEDAVSHLLAATGAKDRRDPGGYWREMYAVFGTGYPWPSW